MSLIALAAAKSCGVTTTTVALAAVWPSDRRVLVVELDPLGGDLAARFGLDSTLGVVSLGRTARRGLDGLDVWPHTQKLAQDTSVLVGTSTPEQSQALVGLWPAIPAALSRLRADVLVDCGRLDPRSPAMEVVRQADAVVMVLRPRVEQVAHLASRLAQIQTAGRDVGVVVIGDRPYSPAEVADAVGLPLWGVLADDPEAAAGLAGASTPRRRMERSPLLRAARSVSASLLERLARANDHTGLGEGGGGGAAPDSTANGHRAGTPAAVQAEDL